MHPSSEERHELPAFTPEDRNLSGQFPLDASFSFKRIQDKPLDAEALQNRLPLPFDSGYLLQSTKDPEHGPHQVYYEQRGNPEGIPVLIVHGGPGYIFPEEALGFLHRDEYRVVLIHQRGIGNSYPTGSLVENTTENLVKDMEAVRQTLSIDSWHVFGWSWGSTLATAYTLEHPNSIKSLTAYGLYLGTAEEDAFNFKNLESSSPEAYLRIRSYSPEPMGMADGFLPYIELPAGKTLDNAVRAWMELSDEHPVDDYLRARFRLGIHYFARGLHLPEQDYLMENATELAPVPVHVFHGTEDRYCAASTVNQFTKAIYSSNVHFVRASHMVQELAVQQALAAHYDKIAGRTSA